MYNGKLLYAIVIFYNFGEKHTYTLQQCVFLVYYLLMRNIIIYNIILCVYCC